MSIHEVRVPKVGMSTTEVDVSAWLVGVGDTVSVGSPLVEIETEKVVNIIESTVDGVVTDIVVAEGEVAEVGAVLCQIRLVS